MKFKFSLEAVLKHRKTLEEIAKRDYLEEKHKANEQLKKLNFLYAQIDEARKGAAAKSGGKKVFIEDLQYINSFISKNNIKIEIQKIVFREAMQVTEEKEEILLEAAREFKVIEKLKERRFEGHKKRARKTEIRNLDEMVTLRHGRDPLK